MERSPFKLLKIPEYVVEQERKPTPHPIEALHIADDTVASRTSLDRLMHAVMGRFTSSISPASLALAYSDWAVHLMESPGKWRQLAEKAVLQALRFGIYAAHASTGTRSELCIRPLPHDRRFKNPAWQHWPFNLVNQAFLLNQQWWHYATTGIGGVSHHHELVVSFVTRQMLDTVSPVNFVVTNPEVLEATAEQAGQNFLCGMSNLIEDLERSLGDSPPVGAENFLPGQQVALTKGQVVYRNHLMELIQYGPTTLDVWAEPILIVPAWIMKYYILDLSPGNSLVKYLVERGHTVFMISWHNPDVEDRDLGMEDYLQSGVIDALNAVHAIIPDRTVNAVGYCLGGTLLSIVAAFLARKDDPRINTMTLLAAQTDFTEAGELRLFIDESELNYLEDIMWDQGYLDNRQMAGAFQLLRSHDMIWSRIVNQYLLGRREPMNDLLAWNADATRMPYKMQSEYLRSLFLNNDLVAGRYQVHGKPVSLSDIRAPMFVVGTETDHVAPWRSVYKINLSANTNVTFVLTNGGHNAGIVSEPGHKGRYFRITHWQHGEKFIDAENWYANTPTVDGSWWPAWVDWLEHRSAGRTLAPRYGAPEAGFVPLGPAPGNYVLER